MRLLYKVLLLLLPIIISPQIVTGTPLATGTPPQTYVEMRVEGVQFLLPAKVKVSHVNPVVDFTIISFEYNEDLLLRMYIGNAPSFPLTKVDNADIKETRINGLPAKIIKSTSDSGLYNMDVLVDLAEAYHSTKIDSDNIDEYKLPIYPEYLHMFYKDNSPELSELAAQIINSIEKIDAGD